MESRQIIDNIILVQEAIHSRRGRNNKGMVIKLDMENSFDRVKHSFLFSVLEKYGFSDTSIEWIEFCFGASWIAQMINGRPTQFFKSSRGLRQGLPLSPSLYILMVDSLSQKLEAERRIGRLTCLQIALGVKEINNSQFADDTLLLGASSPIITRRFKKLLDKFLIAFGGKINCSKSKIYCWNISGHLQGEISIIFGFPLLVSWKYFKYLGMPIFLNSSIWQAWQEIMDKLAGRIQSWGARWLNPRGKIVLLKSVLSSLTIFQCAGLLPPRGMLEKISKHLRSFLWEGGTKILRSST
jgi:hypothetical protein